MSHRIEVSSQPARTVKGARIPDQGSSKTASYNHHRCSLEFREAVRAASPKEPPQAAEATAQRCAARPAFHGKPLRYLSDKDWRELPPSQRASRPPLPSRRSPNPNRSGHSPARGKPEPTDEPAAAPPAETPLASHRSRMGRVSRSRQRCSTGPSKEEGINFETLIRPHNA